MTSFVLSGETSSFWTLVDPPLNRPVTDRLTFGSSAPVTASTDATLVRATLSTLLNDPPRMTLLPHSAMSFTVPAAVAVNAVMRAPVTASSFAIRVAAAPPTDVNEPAMITAVPPGATTMEVISPLTFGLNAVSITPVVALNARMRFRVNVVVLPAFCAWVKVPAAIIRFPTCTIASTLPLVMFGVKFTGSAETTCDWDIWNA